MIGIRRQPQRAWVFGVSLRQAVGMGGFNISVLFTMNDQHRGFYLRDSQSITARRSSAS